ncbi:MAG: class I SAM-dependent methyltransferase [Burkholderiales bacterium]|jgi:ubiquinone/menaquinone biosynthesis C-methylase UbiE
MVSPSTRSETRKGLTGLLAAVLEARGVSRPDATSRQETKDATRRNWTAVPCGSDATTADRHSLEYFEGIEQYRYRTQPWTAQAIDRLELEGRRVLELGVGAGTDHIRIARRGARCVGIDLTPQSCVETRKRFALDGRSARLALADMEALPFRDRSFDVVYSLGAVHHTPDVARVAAEIARVLEPGGRAWVAVYHRSSIFFWWSVFLYRFVARGAWRRRSLRAQLSLVEHPNTNEDLVVLLHTPRELAAFFDAAGFGEVRTHVRHLVPSDVAGLDVLLREPERPRAWMTWLGRIWGWYVVLEARR